MPLKDLLIALVVIIAWGVNFVVIKVGLDGLPPMLLGALRFALVAFPAILLVKRPKLPWRWLIAYGATISWDSSRSCSGHVQRHATGAGLVGAAISGVLHLGFCRAVLGERLRLASVLGLLVAAGGLVLIGSEDGSHVPLLALLLTLCAGPCGDGQYHYPALWLGGLVALVIWGGLIPPLPFWRCHGGSKVRSALAMHWPTSA